MTTPACEALLASAEGLACAGTVRERGGGPAVTARSPGRAFRLDDDLGRTWLGLALDEACADGAFWLPDPPPPRVVVVELKSGTFGDAERQLERSVRALIRKFSAVGCEVAVIALACMSGTSPGGLPGLVTRFRKRTGVRLTVKSGLRRSVDIDEILPRE